MRLIHLHSSEKKIEWFGYGEWVEEPDEISFEHEGYKCLIVRKVMPESNSSIFGGYFCGYVCIHKDHPWYGKGFDEITCECHKRLTFAEILGNWEFWVGFDCAHSGDLVPSMDYLRKTHPDFIKMHQEHEERKKDFPHSLDHLFVNTYKNSNYAIEECKSIAEQAKALSHVNGILEEPGQIRS